MFADGLAGSVVVLDEEGGGAGQGEGRGGGGSGDGGGDFEAELGAKAEYAFGADVSAHAIDDLFGDGKAEAGAAEAAGGGRVGLDEGFEDAREGFAGDADAGVGDLDEEGVLAGAAAWLGAEEDVAGGGEFDGVADEVDEDLAEASGVAAEAGWEGGVKAEDDFDAFGEGGAGEEFGGLFEDGAGFEFDGIEFEAAGFDFGEVEDIGDQGEEGFAGAADGFDELFLVAVEGGFGEEAGHADDGVDGGADFVADGGEEGAFGAGGGFGFIAGFGEPLGLEAEGDFVAFAGGDVAERTGDAEGVAGGVAAGGGAGAEPAEGAIGVFDAELDVEGRGEAGEKEFEGGFDGGPVIDVHGGEPGHHVAGGFGVGLAEDFGAARGDEDIAGGHGPIEDAVVVGGAGHFPAFLFSCRGMSWGKAAFDFEGGEGGEIGEGGGVGFGEGWVGGGVKQTKCADVRGVDGEWGGGEEAYGGRAGDERVGLEERIGGGVGNGEGMGGGCGVGEEGEAGDERVFFDAETGGEAHAAFAEESDGDDGDAEAGLREAGDTGERLLVGRAGSVAAAMDLAPRGFIGRQRRRHVVIAAANRGSVGLFWHGGRDVGHPEEPIPDNDRGVRAAILLIFHAEY